MSELTTDYMEAQATSTSELKIDLKILRFEVRNLKDERDGFLKSEAIDANVERVRRDVGIDGVQDKINEINEILLYRSKTIENE